MFSLFTFINSEFLAGLTRGGVCARMRLKQYGIFYLGFQIVKRTALNFIVDLISFVNLLGLGFTGFIIKFILPPGSGGHGQGFRGGRGQGEVKLFWSMSRHEWGDIHFYLAVLFVFLIVVHIILHWGWIKNYFNSLFRISRKVV